MALTRSTARRYAEAAFEIAERDDSMEAWLAAMSVVDERLSQTDVVRLLTNPAVPTASRVEVLERLLGDDVAGPAHNLFALMIRRGRFELLPAVIREFRRLHARREGIVAATVVSAAQLDEAEQHELHERLVAMTGSRIEMELQVDPALLGGLQVRLGDVLIDGSVRGRLERMRNSFTTSAI
jgi:F-type H+-transporting ATPase subunit delta